MRWYVNDREPRVGDIVSVFREGKDRYARDAVIRDLCYGDKDGVWVQFLDNNEVDYCEADGFDFIIEED